MVGFAFQNGGSRLFLPGPVEGLRTARFLFVGAGAVEALLQGVAVHHGLDEFDAQARREFEARLGFKAVGIEGNHRYLGQPFFVQGFVDEADVVGCTAHAAGLGHHDGCAVQVVFP